MVCSHSSAGVAPGEAPKAEATELAPEASRRRPSRQRLKPGWSQPVAEEGLPGRHLLLVKLPSGGFGPLKERAFRMVFSLVLSDQLPQSRSRTLEEALHPRAVASRVVIFAGRFAQDWFWSCPGGVAWGDVEIATLIASLQLPIQPEFHAQALAPHTGLGFSRGI